MAAQFRGRVVPERARKARPRASTSFLWHTFALSFCGCRREIAGGRGAWGQHRESEQWPWLGGQRGVNTPPVVCRVLGACAYFFPCRGVRPWGKRGGRCSCRQRLSGGLPEPTTHPRFSLCQPAPPWAFWRPECCPPPTHPRVAPSWGPQSQSHIPSSWAPLLTACLLARGRERERER